MKSRLGFTLIELLIVVAVIAILAAIAVPNFLEAQVRSKVSRTRADMAAVSSAIRSYYADHNRYPPNNPELFRFLRAASEAEELNAESLPTPDDAPLSWTSDDPDADKRSSAGEQLATGWGGRYGAIAYGRYPILARSGFDLRVLTTPVAYHHGSLPTDPFHDIRDSPFVYLNYADLAAAGPIVGPAGRYPRWLLLSYGPDTDSMKARFNPARGPFLPYDPTNGTVSRGEILMFGDGSAATREGDLEPANPGPGDTSADMDWGVPI